MLICLHSMVKLVSWYSAEELDASIANCDIFVVVQIRCSIDLVDQRALFINH